MVHGPSDLKAVGLWIKSDSTGFEVCIYGCMSENEPAEKAFGDNIYEVAERTSDGAMV